MDIRQVYQNEMSGIRYNKELDLRILAMANEKGFRNSRFGWKLCVVAMVCVMMLAINFDVIVGYAESVYGKFSLILSGDVIKLSDMPPISITLDKYMTSEKVVKSKDGTSNWMDFESQEQLYEYTGLMLETSDQIELKELSMSINMTYCLGRVFSKVWYYGEDQISKGITLNGMFIMEGFTEEIFGYGEDNKAYKVHEYSDGKKAYFVRREFGEKEQVVYFAERGILYQLFVENNKEGTALAMRIIDSMAE